MELSLKIELSDEQYKDLMQSSYDEIFKSTQMIDALRTVVVDHFVQYFNEDMYCPKDKNSTGVYVGSSQRRNIVEKALIDEEESRGYSYTRNYKPTSLLDQIVRDATSEQMEEFRSRIREITKTFLDNPKTIAQIIHQVICESVRIGLSQGNEDLLARRQNNDARMSMIEGTVQSIMQKFNGN